MKRMFRTLALLMAALLTVYIIGCGGDDDDDDDEVEVVDASFQSATPPGGEIAANGTITVTFENDPGSITASAGVVSGDGKSRTISGPFTSGPLELALSWEKGGVSYTLNLNYTVTAPPKLILPCFVGMTLEPGESCRHNGSTFEVRQDGYGCLDNSICAGIGINISARNIRFSASKNDDGTWTIEGL